MNLFASLLRLDLMCVSGLATSTSCCETNCDNTDGYSQRQADSSQLVVLHRRLEWKRRGIRVLRSVGIGQFREGAIPGDRLRPISTSASSFFRVRPISTSANSISANLGMLNFGLTKCGALEGWAPKGGGPNQEKVGSRRVGPRRVGLRGVGLRRVGPRRVEPSGALKGGWGPKVCGPEGVPPQFLSPGASHDNLRAQTSPKFHERTPRERKKKENCGGGG